MFYTLDDALRISRQIGRRPREFVSEELRGWRWNEPPILSTSGVQLSVSDIAGGLCPVGRDVYMRYVVREREEENPQLQRGLLVHMTYEAAIRTVKRLIYEERVASGTQLADAMRDVGNEEFRRIYDSRRWLLEAEVAGRIFWSLWGQATTTYSGALDRVRTRSRYLSLESIVNAVVPIDVEVVVDGTLVGLSKSLRIDAVLFPTIPVEIKTRPPSRVFETALAGYALALESQFEIPVDFGVLIYVSIDDEGNTVYHEKVVPISDELRLEFIHERDRRLEIVEKGLDPGKPSKCNMWCPYLRKCGGAEKDLTGRRVGLSAKAKERSANTNGGL